MNQASEGVFSKLKVVLEVQELDMQMIRLMRLKKERQKELAKMNSLHKEWEEKIANHQATLNRLKTEARLQEGEIELIVQMLKKLEGQQSGIKRIEEFNALNHEITTKEKDRIIREQTLSNLYDRIVEEERMIEEFTQTLDTSVKEDAVLAEEIKEGIEMINVEGKELQAKHKELVVHCDPELYEIYQRLLKNKRDRVIVPIENRACSGCHIILTAQDENLVRKGHRLVACEHCSRILYLQEVREEGGKGTVQRRRRRSSKVS